MPALLRLGISNDTRGSRGCSVKSASRLAPVPDRGRLAPRAPQHPGATPVLGLVREQSSSFPSQSIEWSEKGIDRRVAITAPERATSLSESRAHGPADGAATTR